MAKVSDTLNNYTDSTSVEGSAVMSEAELPNGAFNETGQKPSAPVIHSLKEINAHRILLRDLVHTINTAYAGKDEDFSGSLRFPKDQDLIDQWVGKGGNPLTAIIRVAEQMVATSTIFPWREPEGSMADINFRRDRPEDVALVEAGQSYEIGGVATLNGPATRGKGLATQCIEALEKAMIEKHKGGDILLWLHTAEHQNGPYWRRRGFEKVYVEMKPVGYWGCFEPFEFVTMVKRVRRKDEK